MHKDPLSLLNKVKIPYALTTYQAENLVQRYLFPSRTDLYIERKDTEEWHKLLTVEGLVGKGNVRILIADSHVFYGSFKRQSLTWYAFRSLSLTCSKKAGYALKQQKNYSKKTELKCP
jgi:hypothetical protein